MMKKHYLIGLALCAVFTAKSQTIIDFEATSLAVDTFNNGADLSGGFTYFSNGSASDYVHFSNYYDTTYNFNTGFSVSNMTDNTTPGYTNQYSAITGAGVNSTNYAVFYPDGEIAFTHAGPLVLQSVKVTNTTYAALSMMNGDAVGKKFGDTVNAQGTVDGTNGEDFFILKIHGRKANGDTTGVVEVVLADFRFAEDSLDFVVQDWIDVDLMPLNNLTGNVDYLSFSFESSDVGLWGINTPTYFAMDNFTYNSGVVGLDELESSFRVYPNPVKERLQIKDAYGQLTVSDATGKVCFSGTVAGTTSLDFSDLGTGLYFVRLSNQNGVSTHKVIK